MHPIFFIFFGLSLPSLIFYVAPFGRDISENFLWMLFYCNFLALFGALFYRPFCLVLRKKTTLYQEPDLFLKIRILLIIASIINLYIYSKIGFRIAVLDISIRAEIYESAGYIWSLFITLSMTLALLLGVMRSIDLKIGRANKILYIFNIICILGYGMKANALQIILCYVVGLFYFRKIGLNPQRVKKIDILFKVFGASFILIFVFWLLNSLRAGKAYSLTEFVMLIYFYLIPPFTNFANVATQSFPEDYVFGGLLEGLYKLIFIKTNPLGNLDLADLENPTWNVWGVFANLYASGGLFELYLGCFLIGLYVAFSYALYRKRNSLLVSMNFAQMGVLVLMLHNSYYYQSFSPFLSIFMCGFLVKTKNRQSRKIHS